MDRVIKRIIIIAIITIAGISISITIISEKEKPTQISTALSLIIAGVITGIIYYYQERGQEQMQEALINIDLLSNGALDRENISQRGFLYETLFAFMDLLSTDNTNDFDNKYEKLRNFIENNYFSNFGIEKKTDQLLSDFLKTRNIC